MDINIATIFYTLGRVAMVLGGIGIALAIGLLIEMKQGRPCTMPHLIGLLFLGIIFGISLIVALRL